jgi:hypothetical protein
LWILGISPLERSKRARPETFESVLKTLGRQRLKPDAPELSDELHDAVKLTIYVGRKERGFRLMHACLQFQRQRRFPVNTLTGQLRMWYATLAS